MTTDAAGRRVMAKVTGTPKRLPAWLVRRASDAARHPCVVELVGVDRWGIRSMLLTAYVEGAALAASDRCRLKRGRSLAPLATLSPVSRDSAWSMAPSARARHRRTGRPPCSAGWPRRTGRRARRAGAGPGPGLRRSGHGRLPSTELCFRRLRIGALTPCLAPDPPPGHWLATVGRGGNDCRRRPRPSARTVAEALRGGVPAARLPVGSPPQRSPAPPRPRPADPLTALPRAGGRRPALGCAFSAVLPPQLPPSS